MLYLTQEFAEQVKPFTFLEYNKIFSVYLYAACYKTDVFAAYSASKGVEGNGYEWDALAALYIAENLPRYKVQFTHDSEADMFCIYSKNEKAVYEFLKGFKQYCDDEANFCYLMENAKFEEWN